MESDAMLIFGGRREASDGMLRTLAFGFELRVCWSAVQVFDPVLSLE